MLILFKTTRNLEAKAQYVYTYATSSLARDMQRNAKPPPAAYAWLMSQLIAHRDICRGRGHAPPLGSGTWIGAGQVSWS
jgi:hypothetical protein